jgi:hypothetical protein
MAQQLIPKFEIGDFVLLDLSVDSYYGLITDIIIDPTQSISIRYTVLILIDNTKFTDAYEGWLTLVKEIT